MHQKHRQYNLINIKHKTNNHFCCNLYHKTCISFGITSMSQIECFLGSEKTLSAQIPFRFLFVKGLTIYIQLGGFSSVSCSKIHSIQELVDPIEISSDWCCSIWGPILQELQNPFSWEAFYLYYALTFIQFKIFWTKFKSFQLPVQLEVGPTVT